MRDVLAAVSLPKLLISIAKVVKNLVSRPPKVRDTMLIAHEGTQSFRTWLVQSPF